MRRDTHGFSRSGQTQGFIWITRVFWPYNITKTLLWVQHFGRLTKPSYNHTVFIIFPVSFPTFRVLLLCYQLNWNVTLEYTNTYFNVWDQTQLGNPSPTFHTHQRTLNFDAVMVVVSQKLGRKCIVPAESWTRNLWCANLLCYPYAHSCFFRCDVTNNTVMRGREINFNFKSIFIKNISSKNWKFQKK